MGRGVVLHIVTAPRLIMLFSIPAIFAEPAKITFFRNAHFFATVRSMGQKSWDNKAIKGKGG
jgi:hypothetical protein